MTATTPTAAPTPTPNEAGEVVDKYDRQHALLNPITARNTKVAILGVGTVGSNVAEQMAKAGFGHFVLADMDDIELHNVPSQAFNVADVGRPKTEVARERILAVNPEAHVDLMGELEGGEQFDAQILVAAVDNMELRKTIFDMSVRSNPTIELFMDFRMGGFLLQAWAMNPTDAKLVKRYSSTLYGSDEVVEAVCGTRTFCTVGAISGALATQLVTNHLSPEPNEDSDDERPAVPFYTMFDLGTFQLNTAGSGR